MIPLLPIPFLRALRPWFRAACLTSLIFAGTLAQGEEPIEGAPVFFARDLVDPKLLKSDCYRVKPVVELREFTYQFTIECDKGRYVANGKDDLYKVLHEIEVIEDLEEVSQTEAFAGAVSDTIASPFVTTFGVARRPIASVIGLPGGVARYLGGKLYQVKRGSDKAVLKFKEIRSSWDDEADSKELAEASEDDDKDTLTEKAGKLSRRHLGHDSAKRKWARKLAVDPYSNNLALQEALGRIAWATSIGEFAGDFAVPSSEVFSYAGKTRELVWDKPGHQLELEIMSALKKCGVNKDLAVEFRDSDVYSLTEKVDLSLAFLKLNPSNSVPFLVEYALRAETKEDTEAFLRTMEILVIYVCDVAEIRTIGERKGLLVASSTNGYDVYPLPVDYLHWTPLVYEPLLSEELWDEKREIWVAGQVSPISRMRLKHHGWEVFDDIEKDRRQAWADTPKYSFLKIPGL